MGNHTSILCSTGMGRHFSHQNLPTLFYAPSLETDKALDVTSFTVNLFDTDEILALRLKATLAKNFATLLVWHVFEPSELNGRNVHGLGNSKPLDARNIDMIKEVVHQYFLTPSEHELLWRD